MIDYRVLSKVNIAVKLAHIYGAYLWCGGLWVRVPSVPMLGLKLSVLEIPLDKELAANCLKETRTKLVVIKPFVIV